MNTTLVTDTDALISRKLTGLYVRFEQERTNNPRTKATTVARAKLNGAAELAYELGYGLTPAHISSTVRDMIDTRATGSALAERFAGLRISGQHR